MPTPLEQVVRTALAAAPAPPAPWPAYFADRFARTAGRPGLVPPPLRADALSAHLTGVLGIPAFELGGTVWLHPALLRHAGSCALDHLLAHEAAHALQRGGSDSGSLHSQPAAEAEAEDFAAALRAGCTAPIAPRAGLPPLQPPIPLLAILLIAGLGLTIGGMYISQSRAADRRQARLPPEHRDPHLYETGWGFVPFVGSASQLFSGENWALQAGGAVFLVLDFTLVGGLVAKGIVKGALIFSTRAMLREGLEEVARGGGTVLQKEAAVELGEAAARGEIRLGSKEAIEQVVRQQIAGAKGPIVIVGSTGWANHSVTFLVLDGTIYKLHGGILRTAYPLTRNALAERATAAWLRKFNRVTIVGGEQLLGDTALREQIEFWQMMNAGFKNKALNTLLAEGCSGSQAMLLERLGLYNAGATERLLPYLLDRGVARAGYASYLINPWRAAAGTGIQASLYLSAGAMYESRTLFNMLDAPPQEAYFAHNLDRNTVPAMIVEESGLSQFGLNLTGLPSLTSADMVYPEEMTFRDADPDVVRAVVTSAAWRGAPALTLRPELELPPLPNPFVPTSDFEFPVIEEHKPPPGVIWDSTTGLCRPAESPGRPLTLPPLR